MERNIDRGLSAQKLMEQAGWTAEHYLCRSIEFIDKHLGKGYAKAHPELLGAVVQTCARDFHTSMMTKVGDCLVEAVGENLSTISATLGFEGTIVQALDGIAHEVGDLEHPAEPVVVRLDP